MVGGKVLGVAAAWFVGEDHGKEHGV